MRTNPGPILPAASSLNLHGRCRDHEPGTDIYAAMDELGKSIVCLRDYVGILADRLAPVCVNEPTSEHSSLVVDGRCPLSGDIRQRSVEVAALVEQVADVLRRLQLP